MRPMATKVSSYLVLRVMLSPTTESPFSGRRKVRAWRLAGSQRAVSSRAARGRNSFKGDSFERGLKAANSTKPRRELRTFCPLLWRTSRLRGDPAGPQDAGGVGGQVGRVDGADDGAADPGVGEDHGEALRHRVAPRAGEMAAGQGLLDQHAPAKGLAAIDHRHLLPVCQIPG